MSTVQLKLRCTTHSDINKIIMILVTISCFRNHFYISYFCICFKRFFSLLVSLWHASSCCYCCCVVVVVVVVVVAVAAAAVVAVAVVFLFFGTTCYNPISTSNRKTIY